MKVVVITVPMRPPDGIKAVIYPANGEKTLEYGKPVRFPVNSLLANTLKKDEQVRVIFIMTASENSNCEQNKKNFIEELESINTEIGAVLSYDIVKIDFEATKQTYNKLITDLADKIPDDAELYNDITYGFKTQVISLFCAFKFAEEFRDAVVQYIVYGKVEFDGNGKPVNPVLFDITSLYYLFNLMGSMRASDAESASKKLKDFFAL